MRKRAIVWAVMVIVECKLKKPDALLQGLHLVLVFPDLVLKLLCTGLHVQEHLNT